MASPRFLVSIFEGSSPSTPECKGYNMNVTTNYLLTYDTRNTYGKNYNRRLRSHNLIPAVAYSKTNFLKHLIVKKAEISKYKLFKNMFVKLVSSNGDDKSNIFAIVKDLQIDIIKRDITHIDFLKINENQRLKVKIPFLFRNADKYKSSGRMNIVNKYLYIDCEANRIPRFIDIDMLDLVAQKKRLSVDDIKKFVSDDISIVSGATDLIAIFK